MSVTRKIGRRKFLAMGGSAAATAIVLGAGGWMGGIGPELEAAGPQGKLVFRDPEPTRLPDTVRIEIETLRGSPTGLLHMAKEANSGIIMIGSNAGGIGGPASVYQPLATLLQNDGITALRLECRKLDSSEECAYDVLAAIDALREQGVESFVLVGWGFGGAVAIQAGASSRAVYGVAAIASQIIDGTVEIIASLSPRSVLLIHGEDDFSVPAFFSKELYQKAGQPKELVIYEGTGRHMYSHANELLEKLYVWSTATLLGNPG